jgi:transcriptional regulator with XRE-family HTH domain
MSSFPNEDQPGNPPMNAHVSPLQARYYVKEHFSLALRNLRVERGLSQSELSEKMDVVPLTIYRWENGIALPYLQYRRKLCQIFHVDMGTLFPSLHVPGPAATVPPSVVNDDSKIGSEEKAQGDASEHGQNVLAAERHNLDRLKIQKERMTNAIEIANMVVDAFFPNLEQSARDTTVVALLQKLLQEPGEATINSFIEHYRPLHMNARKAENG